MTVATELDLSRIDLSDLALWQPEPPFELFRQLRREAPVHWCPLGGWPDDPGAWSITRHADVHMISRDHATFSSERNGVLHVNDFGIPLVLQQQMMIASDPPRHDRLKMIVQRAFTPRRVADHAESIREIVGGVLDRAAARGECDLVTDIAQLVPARVIGSLLGTPPEDDPKLVSWTNVISAFEDPVSRVEWDDAQKTLAEAWEYILTMKASRLADPQNDLLTALVHAEVDGDQLSDSELVVFFILLMVAGNDSTRATYSAGQLALMENPEQRRRLLDEPQLIPAAVEESLRMFPAFAYFARTTTRDVELHGTTIPEGDKLLMWYISSNRDETVFERPDEFDLTRPDLGEHQAFGAGGRHFCLGTGLARLELAIWFEETLRRFPDMSLVGTPTRVHSIFVNQHRSIPVRLGG